MRLLHWLYAKYKGYWWLHCPHCNYAFGGHEAVVHTEYAGAQSWQTDVRCPNCEMPV